MFAAGNGKIEGDNCACDGYVNSIYTIVIASCDDSGHVAHYSERCASIMATAYSGSGQEKNVVCITIILGLDLSLESLLTTVIGCHKFWY